MKALPHTAQQERDELRPREKIRGLGLRHIFVQSRTLNYYIFSGHDFRQIASHIVIYN